LKPDVARHSEEGTMSALRKRKDDLAADQAGPFLGVVASAKGLQWRERLNASDVAQAEAISQRLSAPHALGRILAARGVTADTAAQFLEPTIKALMPDPSILVGLDQGAARLADAVQKGERVAVFGDYDVDGASSSALLHRFFKHHGNACRVYIPDRLFEGYGPNAAAIDMLAKEGAQLIVTADCGTTSFEPLAAAKKHNVDVVVIDHHQADEKLPDVHSVINPNRQDDLSGLGHLCAAGVVFMVLVGAVRTLRARGHYKGERNAPDLLSMLDLVALATICDVVPLQTLNRAFVTKGLKVMRARNNIGLRALYDAAGLDQSPTPYHLGFVLGPRINAGGRIGDSGLGSKLLALDDELEAGKIAALLDKLNRERRAIEQEMLAEAMAKAEAMLAETPDLPVIIVGSDTWHKGVVGLVSSRLTDRFRRPSCVIAWSTGEGGTPKDQGTGSLRSITGVDIGGAVRSAVAAGHLDKGGGHAMAAGLTVSRAKYETLSAYLMTALQKTSTTARLSVSLEIDGALTPASATPEFMDLIDRAGPYGQGNPTPRFVFPAHRVKFAKVVGEAHVRCTLEAGDGSRLDAVAFRAAGQPIGDALIGANGMSLHIAGTLKRDTWGGRNRLELTIDDVADPAKQR
jgi:single-stranded-DNA-specific exonuclease